MKSREASGRRSLFIVASLHTASSFSRLELVLPCGAPLAFAQGSRRFPDPLSFLARSDKKQRNKGM
jgi:hypothetical protein